MVRREEVIRVVVLGVEVLAGVVNYDFTVHNFLVIFFFRFIIGLVDIFFFLLLLIFIIFVIKADLYCVVVFTLILGYLIILFSPFF